MILPSLLYSQKNEERKGDASQSDKQAQTSLSEKLKKEESNRRIRISNYLNQNTDKKRIVKDDETGKIEIRDIFPDGTPFYFATSNEGAALTARTNSLYSGGSLGINIQGEGMTAWVWDGGPVRDTHEEFMINGTSKVTIADYSTMSDHATHVAGTIAARGVLTIPITGGTTTVRGLAFNSAIKSYDWTDDLSEMEDQAGKGMLVSNHSYGPVLSSNNSIWYLGSYFTDAQGVDEICYNYPFYLPVFAAGNDRDESGIPYGTQISNKLGYDLIAGEGVAKNVMTVAAVYEVPSYVNSSSVTMSSFSNYGPTDDGRIKPEISAKGVSVRSTTSNSDTSTGFKNGTSMAAPGVTAVALLLQQYYKQLYGNNMKAATLKGLILHTADEAGDYPGPDYSYGWGLINADASARVIRDKNLITNRSIVQELNLNNQAIYTQTISATSSRPLKVSISWTDPAGALAAAGMIDSATKNLVNDLDVKVISSNGTVYYPWKLQGMTNTFGPATNSSTNDVDNFERIDIPNPSGTYTITVTHKGSLTNNHQNFTLIASAPNLTTLSVSDSASGVKDKLQIYPNPVQDILNIKGNKNVEASIIILDASGRILSKESVKNAKVNVKELIPGTYMLIYKDKIGREFSEKFIKK